MPSNDHNFRGRGSGQDFRGRAAMVIRERMLVQHRHRLAELHDAMSVPAGTIERLRRLHRQLDHCRRNQFAAAAEKLRVDTQRWLDQLTHEVRCARDRLRAPRPQPPTFRGLIGELNQIDEEFGGCTYEPRGQTLSAVTDPISLGDPPVHLGRFRIELDVRRLGETDALHRPPLTVIALDPNPAASADHVAHPHVSDDQPCLGEASEPIRRALCDGRLADVFLLVRSVLTTYNPASPYVSLDDWTGQLCHDCGDRVHDDDACYCEGCEHEYCEQCFGCCHLCDESLCYGCLTECPACEQWGCTRCVGRCARCERLCCTDCLGPEDDLCPACTPNEPHEEPDHDEDTAATPEPAAA